jgi:uncharacterized protein
MHHESFTLHAWLSTLLAVLAASPQRADDGCMPLRVTFRLLRLATAALLAMAVLFLVAACGGGTDGLPVDAPRGPAATPTESVATPTEEAELPAFDEPVASTAVIPTADLPLVRFTALDGASAELPIEVPPREEYRIGLSGRHELRGRGMLFYYPSGENTGGFWMRDTHIDLDIAFVDADHEVIEVLRMLADTDEIHYASRPYLAAIEAPAGWFGAHGIAAGAAVEFLFEIPEHLH